jgi:hypothetical protein
MRHTAPQPPTAATSARKCCLSDAAIAAAGSDTENCSLQVRMSQTRDVRRTERTRTDTASADQSSRKGIIGRADAPASLQPTPAMHPPTLARTAPPADIAPRSPRPRWTELRRLNAVPRHSQHESCRHARHSRAISRRRVKREANRSGLVPFKSRVRFIPPLPTWPRGRRGTTGPPSILRLVVIVKARVPHPPREREGTIRPDETRLGDPSSGGRALERALGISG